jgi:hypothetical protein
MRPAFLSYLYYLVHTRAADRHWQAHRETPAQALAPAATPQAETRYATRPACR